VARKAGVSHTTVSNVLNNVPKVSEETKQRVLAAMRELNFEPNLAAKSLYTKRSYIVGYMVPAITNEFFMNVARGAERVFYREGIGLFLCDTGLDPARESDYVRRLTRHRADGLVVNYVASRRTIKDALKSGIPVVAVESPVDEPGVSLVSVDNHGAAMLGVEHLCELGHRRIGVLAVDFESDVNRERLRGFRSGLKLHDMESDPALEVSMATSERQNGYFDHSTDLAKSPVTAHRQFSEVVRGILTAPAPPTALFCFDYHTTALLIQCLTRMGLTPGEQVSVIGFDAPATLCAPEVTSIIQPAPEMGSIAANLLMERITDPKSKPRTVRLSAQIHVGETTRRPPV
jgi:DNA-binding LacI/PurR family transcriptional regulator